MRKPDMKIDTIDDEKWAHLTRQVMEEDAELLRRLANA